jgi:hypothetical protein
MAGFFESMLPAAGSMYGYTELMDNLQNQRGDIRQFLGMGGVDDLLGRTYEEGGFNPYTLRGGGGIGAINYGPEGMEMNMSPYQRTMAQGLWEGGQDMAQRSLVDPAQRTQDIYGRMQEAQAPGIARDRAQLQQQLYSQGRQGIRTGAYGGTPEQLAQEMAIAEQRDKSYLGAMGQALGEQQQQWNIGQGMLNQGYVPLQQLQNQAKIGLGYGDQMQQGQQGMWNNYLNLALGGMGTDVQLQNIKAQMMSNMINSAMPLASGAGRAADSALGGLWDMVGGWFNKGE